MKDYIFKAINETSKTGDIVKLQHKEDNSPILAIERPKNNNGIFNIYCQSQSTSHKIAKLYLEYLTMSGVVKLISYTEKVVKDEL